MVIPNPTYPAITTPQGSSSVMKFPNLSSNSTQIGIAPNDEKTQKFINETVFKSSILHVSYPCIYQAQYHFGSVWVKPIFWKTVISFYSQNAIMSFEYRKDASSNTLYIKAHTGLFILSMKGIFDAYRCVQKSTWNWSVWCKMSLGKVGVATPLSFWLQVTEDFFLNLIIFS